MVISSFKTFQYIFVDTGWRTRFLGHQKSQKKISRNFRYFCKNSDFLIIIQKIVQKFLRRKFFDFTDFIFLLRCLENSSKLNKSTKKKKMSSFWKNCKKHRFCRFRNDRPSVKNMGIIQWKVFRFSIFFNKRCV